MTPRTRRDGYPTPTRGTAHDTMSPCAGIAPDAASPAYPGAANLTERTSRPVNAAPEPLWLDEPAGEAVSRAFGEANRRRLLDRYFDASPVPEPETAWLHVYRLLLWINRTIGLAHCYESDKCQPGKPWYPRSLAFHGWLATQMNSTPAGLAANIDLLFREVSGDLISIVER